MRRRFYPYILLFTAGILAGCTVREVPEPLNNDSFEMKGVQAVIVNEPATKAGTVTPLADYVGRSVFKGGDQVVFTRISRTVQPLDAFTYPGPEATYPGIIFQAGTEGGWQRQTSDGGPERIYWTDAASDHTFIAYGVPQDSESPGFDWKSHKYTSETTTKTYFIGSLGNPSLTGANDIIDYSLTAEEQEANKELVNNTLVYYNPKLEKEDLVIAYDTQMHAEPGGSVALVQFHHALSSVRVVVNISGFSSSSTAADNEAVVSNMVLLHQPTMYAWEQSQFGTQPLREADQVIINGAWAGSASIPSYDQRKDIKLWIPRPAGAGDKQSKTFTFYAITTPQPENYISTLPEDDVKRMAELTFKVTYPDPLKPSQTVTKPYTASLKDVYFEAGFNTTINISLNHKNEQMTVGAEYENWQFVATPDVSELFKYSTYLQDTDRFIPGTEIPNVTIVGDEKATVDDATWLYESAGIVYDIYGHDGSSIEDAYQISTAYQLLSFAYEVKNGRDFTDKYVRLDADITLQKSTDKTKEELPLDDDSRSSAENAITWIGIGDDTHAFNGAFLGGERYIYSLKGAPLFAKLGPKAQILKLQVGALQTADGSTAVTGRGLLANSNEGLISACKIVDDVSLSESSAGAFVGTNTGTIYASYHIGATTGAGTTGGLVGSNSGTIRNSYHVGKVTGTTTGGITAENSGTLTNNYYNSTLLPSPTVSFEGATGKSTSKMTSPSFVTAINIGIGEFSGTAPDDLWSYVLRPADYPKIGDYVQLNGWLETDLTSISGTDDIFVIVGNNGSNYAMSNDNGAFKSPSAVPVTVKSGAIPDIVPSNLQWTLSSSASGYTFYPYGDNGVSLYVMPGTSNRNVNVREATDNNVFTLDGDGFLQNTGTSRFLGIYNSEEWRSYMSHTDKTDNINNQVFKFYKFYADDKNAALMLSHAGTVRYGDAPFNLVISNPHSVTYTLTSSDESVAEVTHEGNVTVKKAGKITLSAAWEAQNSFRAGQYNYVLTVWPIAATISFDNPQTSLKVGQSVTNAATVDPSGVTVTYSSSNESVATVNATTGEVTGIAKGTAEITATVTDDNYDTVSAKYTISVIENMAVTLTQTNGGSFTASAGGSTINSGTELAVDEIVTLDATPADGYSFRSWRVFRTDDPSVIVDVTNNQFSMPPYGVTVTATFDQSTSALYYVKVTSADELTDGDYLIVHEASGNVLTGVNNSNIGTYAGVTITNNRIAYSAASAHNIAIGKNGSQFRMKQNGKYLAYTSSSTSGNNYLYAVDDPYTNGTLWMLAVDGAQNVYNTSRRLQWNNDRFCCYTSNQSKISFYKLQEGAPQDTTPRTISITTPSHGTVTTDPSGTTIAGTSVTITATPEEGYLVSNVSVTDGNSAAVSVTPGASDTYTFTMPASDVTIAVEFITLSGYTSKVLTFSEKYGSDTDLDGISVEGDGITVSFAKNSGSTAPKYYSSGSAVRWYGSNTMTVSAGNTIRAIIITYSQKNKSVSADIGTYNHGESLWTGSSDTVTFTVESGSSHNRITSVRVYY